MIRNQTYYTITNPCMISKYIRVPLTLLLLCAHITTFGSDLKALGFEIFINDPEETKKALTAEKTETYENLPDFIDPETWKEDLELDALEGEAPKEPNWSAINKTVELESIGAEECCLRASRASRYAAEEACISEENKVWRLSSIEPDLKGATPDALLGKCAVYNQKKIKAQQKVISSKPKEDDTLTDDNLAATDPYRCIARAVAKCYDPDLEY